MSETTLLRRVLWVVWTAIFVASLAAVKTLDRVSARLVSR